MAHNQIDDGAGNKVFDMPYAVAALGADASEIRLHWSQPVSGKVYATVRMDNLG